MFFDLHVYPNGGCENTGTLDITSLEFIPGKTIETSGGRSLYVTKLDATFTIRCAGSAYPTVGEIHFIAPPP
jgi:hypothetical protein